MKNLYGRKIARGDLGKEQRIPLPKKLEIGELGGYPEGLQSLPKGEPSFNTPEIKKGGQKG